MLRYIIPRTHSSWRQTRSITFTTLTTFTVQEERALAVAQTDNLKVCYADPSFNQVQHWKRKRGNRPVLLAPSPPPPPCFPAQEELRRQERNRDRAENANLEYLKNIVLAYITSKDNTGR